MKPNFERISFAVRQSLRKLFPGVLLLARQNNTPVGVALAVYTPSAELGRVLTVNDFYIDPSVRRQGVGRMLAQGIVEEAKAMEADQVNLEVLPQNKIAAKFWESLGFVTDGRTVYRFDLEPG